eukprot:162369-Pelagomonas_calceolata.AAC.4
MESGVIQVLQACFKVLLVVHSGRHLAKGCLSPAPLEGDEFFVSELQWMIGESVAALKICLFMTPLLHASRAEQERNTTQAEKTLPT